MIPIGFILGVALCLCALGLSVMADICQTIGHVLDDDGCCLVCDIGA